ncbi:uncharacterized protein LOC110011864 [Sesamum indicum]|uniref:Uncharacterized protein LOC110011864 n=1 Tax=Sesamum indicum TaxID=4182 RepID=A0A8M8UY94_SESIN|nr:uncharacterized protein LOC110011864 [Sesamum indicum]
MQPELAALEKNDIRDTVELPKGKKSIGCKWVYKVKLRWDGNVERYKARLVAKGYNQVERVDYFDRFSPVVKVVTIGTILVVASTFAIKDLGPAKYFLELEIAHSIAGMTITQHKFIRDIIKDTGLQSSNSTATPVPMGLKLTAYDAPTLPNPEPYRRLVGRFLYLSFTKPDISFAAQQLSQFVYRPCVVHMNVPLHLVRYLERCPDLGLFFPSSSSFTITAYRDADWAGCVDSRHSLTGYCIFLDEALISWKTKKQTTVARSTVEAEYRNLGATTCELKWISYLLQDLHVSVLQPIPLYCDNQAAMHIFANPVFYECTKHLEIDCNLVRDQYKAGFVLSSYISNKSQFADMYTKLLPHAKFVYSLSKLGLVAFPQAHLQQQSKLSLCHHSTLASASNSLIDE